MYGRHGRKAASSPEVISVAMCVCPLLDTSLQHDPHQIRRCCSFQADQPYSLRLLEQPSKCDSNVAHGVLDMLVALHIVTTLRLPANVRSLHLSRGLPLISSVHHYSAPSSLSFATMPSTSSTLPPPCLTAGSATLTVFNRCVKSMAKSSILSFTKGFFLAFMIFGRLA